MPTEKEVLTGLLSAAYQMDENGVASLYNEDGTELKAEALQTLIDKDAQRIQSLKPDTKKYFDDGYKKAQSESLTKFEKDILDKYGLKSEKKGIELIDDLVAQYIKEGGTDEDKIKKSRYYLDAVEALQKEKDELIKTKSQEFEDFKKQVEQDKAFSKVSSEALVIFDNLKPILPEDAAKSANLKRIFVEELKQFNYEMREGAVIILDKDGNDALDGHGHRIKFDSLVRQTAEKYFEFHQSDPKSAAGFKKDNQAKTVYKINSEQDYIKLRAEAKTTEERAALLEAFNEFKFGKQN